MILLMIGNECGGGNGFQNFKYLFWPDILNYQSDPSAIDLTVCVSECPQYSDLSLCHPNQNYTTCPYADYSSYVCKIPV